jgi:hypothetical protein
MRSMSFAANRFSPTVLAPWLGFAVVAAVYGLVATWRIDLPGVYMDEVNPDYLVVKLLNPGHAPIAGWVLRGNYLLGDRVPWLVQLYHGSQTFWLGLPFFALFGTTVEGLRLTHAMFGAGVLAALYWLLLCARLVPWQGALACAALALDPSFSYAFRTQSYITLAGDAWLLLAIACLLPSADGPASVRRLFWSGVWAGTAVVGYFVHAFFIPALAAGAWWATRAGEARSARRKRAAWLAGCAIGISPYVVGYALLARGAGGVAPAWSFVVAQQASLHAFDSPLGTVERLAYAWKMVVGVVSNAWHHAMMFGAWDEVPGTTAKLALLVGLPGALLAVAAVRRHATFAQVLLGALPVSFVAVALGFGGRLGGHHYVTLLPLFYAALAVGLAPLVPIARASTVARRAIRVAPLALLVALNVNAQVSEGGTLAATRGVGLMSDAINRFAADINADAHPRWYVFPDWGLALPIAFLTRGTVGITSGDDATQARSRLCAGHDVAVALIDGDRTARRNDWTRRLGWDAPDVVHYAQADGKVVFDLLGYRGRADRLGCTTTAPEAPVAAGNAHGD